MTKLFVDTNIILDLLAKREGFYTDAAELFSLADKKQVRLAVSALSFANTDYVLSRLSSPRTSRETLRKFKVLVEVWGLDDKLTELALSDQRFTDFEDGLQYYSALENKADIIITRNKKDFKFSKIPVLTAKEFLAK